MSNSSSSVRATRSTSAASKLTPRLMLPDFTIVARGETWYWEHVGRLDSDAYRNHWETKQAWYDRFFPGRLIVTHETGDLSQEVHRIIEQSFA